MTTVEKIGLSINEVLEGLSDWFGVEEYENVMKRIENGTTNANFGNYTQVPIVNKNKFGRIPLRDFFENNDYGNGEILSLSELQEVLSEDQWEVKSHDNTCNHSGYLEREVDFQTIVGMSDETTIVFYAVHIGLDIRAGYTNSFAVKYDNHYDSLECLLSQFNIANAQYTYNGEKFEISVGGKACSEYLDAYIVNENYEQIGQSYEEQTTNIDVYDHEDFIESITTYLKDNDIEFDNNSVKVID